MTDVLRLARCAVVSCVHWLFLPVVLLVELFSTSQGCRETTAY